MKFCAGCAICCVIKRGPPIHNLLALSPLPELCGRKRQKNRRAFLALLTGTGNEGLVRPIEIEADQIAFNKFRLSTGSSRDIDRLLAKLLGSSKSPIDVDQIAIRP
jgi:hypothetical protein